MSDRSRLAAEGLLDEVEPDAVAARAWLDAADRHLDSAASIAETDPSGAYALLYDAARKAVAAAMLVDGVRVRSRPGAHVAVASYALSLERDQADVLHLARLDEMRRARNRSQYGTRVFGIREVAADLAHARKIVEIAKSVVKASPVDQPIDGDSQL